MPDKLPQFSQKVCLLYNDTFHHSSMRAVNLAACCSLAPETQAKPWTIAGEHLLGLKNAYFQENNLSLLRPW
jgi:hypothetical protein